VIYERTECLAMHAPADPDLYELLVTRSEAFGSSPPWPSGGESNPSPAGPSLA
jgi:hypothetical protein